MNKAAYKKWVRSQPCAECRRRPPSELNHVTYGRGLGQKADDLLSFPLCTKCHSDWHDMRGTFWDMTKTQRRAYQERMVSQHHRLFGIMRHDATDGGDVGKSGPASEG